MEKEGVDTTSINQVAKQLKKMNIRFDINMIRNITGNPCPSFGNEEEIEDQDQKEKHIHFCTPEMISKYVRKLRKEKGDHSEIIKKLL